MIMHGISSAFEHYFLNDSVVVTHMVSGRRFRCRVLDEDWIVNEICSDGVSFLLRDNQVDDVGSSARDYAIRISEGPPPWRH